MDSNDTSYYEELALNRVISTLSTRRFPKDDRETNANSKQKTIGLREKLITRKRRSVSRTIYHITSSKITSINP